jgi:hypothetical protein
LSDHCKRVLVLIVHWRFRAAHVALALPRFAGLTGDVRVMNRVDVLSEHTIAYAAQRGTHALAYATQRPGDVRVDVLKEGGQDFTHHFDTRFPLLGQSNERQVVLEMRECALQHCLCGVFAPVVLTLLHSNTISATQVPQNLKLVVLKKYFKPRGSTCI